jgi:hypothetical protein
MEATFVRDVDGMRGSAKLWQTSEPYSYPSDDWRGEDEKRGTTTYVISSAVDAYGGPETYLFPSDESGEILDWLELDGSYRGGLDHVRAIEGFVASFSKVDA